MDEKGTVQKTGDKIRPGNIAPERVKARKSRKVRIAVTWEYPAMPVGNSL